MSIAVLLPVKAFSRAKARLTPRLSPPERADLARDLAETVVRAARPLPVFVVCDHDEIRTWARDLSLNGPLVEVIWTPARGLNGAVQAGVAHLTDRGFERAIVAHADLPLARSLAWLGDEPGITIVPDRHDDGTNVLSLPTRATFEFHYGPGSFRAHLQAALRSGWATTVARDPSLALDIDHPADLADLADLADREEPR